MFGEKIDRLTSFQDELRTLYRQLLDESATFQNQIRDVNNEIRSANESQNTRLEMIATSLQSYEAAYIAERERTDIERQELMTKLKAFVEEATQTNTSINAENKGLMEGIRDQLTQKLGEIEETLHKQLVSIFHSVDQSGLKSASMLEHTVDKLSGTQANFVNSMNEIITRQQGRFDEQDKIHSEQMNTLTKHNEEIALVMERFDQTSQLQEQQAKALESSVNDLKSDISKLSQTIQTLADAVSPLHGLVQSKEPESESPELRGFFRKIIYRKST